MKLFAVTVLYIKTDGTDCSAVAMVGAPSALEAIDAAAEGVRALPHCREVQGGACEELADLGSNAREPQAPAATHPTHATVN
jgi:hypothetical protein